MRIGKFSLVAVACAAGMQMFTAAAPAATDFTTPTTVDGWLITPASGISLSANTSSSTDLSLTKTATFSTMNEGLVISFTQVSASAASTITFSSESLTNSSGSTWGGFQFQLLDDNGGATFVSNASSPFQPATGYTSGLFTPIEIVYAGSQANAAVSSWGMTSALVLDADPTGVGTNFVLKEVPLTSSETGLPGGVPIPIISPGGTGGVVVPIPAAVWQGGAGLAALALLSLRRKLKAKPQY
jgi:hypothetical protein